MKTHGLDAPALSPELILLDALLAILDATTQAFAITHPEIQGDAPLPLDLPEPCARMLVVIDCVADLRDSIFDYYAASAEDQLAHAPPLDLDDFPF